MLNRRALSDVVEAPSRRLEQKCATEIIQVGQTIKLAAITHGLAPTSLATHGNFKCRPWGPICISPDFYHEIICGDVWLENRLILSTEHGTFLTQGNSSSFEI